MFIDVLNKLMEDRGINKSSLAKGSGIPYTTIDGFYKKGSENIKLSTLQKLSEYFNVSLDYLIKGNECVLNEHEENLIKSYRANPDMQAAVDKILNIDLEDKVKNVKTFPVYRAARSENNEEPTVVQMTSEEIKRIKEAPKVESDEEL